MWSSTWQGIHNPHPVQYFSVTGIHFLSKLFHFNHQVWSLHLWEAVWESIIWFNFCSKKDKIQRTHVPSIKGKKYEHFGLGYIQFGVSWMRLMYDRPTINLYHFLFTCSSFTTMSWVKTTAGKKQEAGNNIKKKPQKEGNCQKAEWHQLEAQQKVNFKEKLEWTKMEQKRECKIVEDLGMETKIKDLNTEDRAKCRETRKLILSHCEQHQCTTPICPQSRTW